MEGQDVRAMAADDGPIRAHAEWIGYGGPGHVDGREFAFVQKEPVHAAARVAEIADNVATVVHPECTRKARAGHIDAGEHAAAQEEAVRAGGIAIVTDDRSSAVDAAGAGGDSARNINHCEVVGEQEISMNVTTGIREVSNHGAGVVQCADTRPSRAGDVDRGEGPVAQYEPVYRAAAVRIHTCDDAIVVDL